MVPPFAASSVPEESPPGEPLGFSPAPRSYEGHRDAGEALCFLLESGTGIETEVRKALCVDHRSAAVHRFTGQGTVGDLTERAVTERAELRVQLPLPPTETRRSITPRMDRPYRQAQNGERVCSPRLLGGSPKPTQRLRPEERADYDCPREFFRSAQRFPASRHRRHCTRWCAARRADHDGEGRRRSHVQRRTSRRPGGYGHR